MKKIRTILIALMLSQLQTFAGNLIESEWDYVDVGDTFWQDIRYTQYNSTTVACNFLSDELTYSNDNEYGVINALEYTKTVLDDGFRMEFSDIHMQNADLFIFVSGKDDLIAHSNCMRIRNGDGFVQFSFLKYLGSEGDPTQYYENTPNFNSIEITPEESFAFSFVKENDSLKIVIDTNGKSIEQYEINNYLSDISPAILFAGQQGAKVTVSDISFLSIPEPSTYATIFGALAFAFVACRRRK